MPIENLHRGTNAAWALWKISEEEAALSAEVFPYEVVPSRITHPTKRLEFLAGRVVIKELLKSWGLNFYGLTKNEFGKPFLKDHPFQVSLSHSYPYVAAAIDRYMPVGIDLEQPKGKLLKIAHRVLNAEELENAGDDIVKHCVYWCGKEALIKIHGKKDLIFAENLKISPFSIQKQGELVGRIIVNNTETAIPLQYHVYENFIVAMNKQDQ